MLPRQKCETLANYYLGFNGWSGKVQYHKQEETEEGKVDRIIDDLDRLSFSKGEGGFNRTTGLSTIRTLLRGRGYGGG